VKKYIKPKSMTMKMRNGRRLVHGFDCTTFPFASVDAVVVPPIQLLTETINPSKAAIIPKLRIFVFRKSRLLH